MKTMNKIFLALAASAAFFSGAAMADSPLTSTTFTAAYPEFQIVQDTAKNENKTLNNEQAAFLVSEDTPVGARAALVNALGWNISGQTNAFLFLNYLENKDVDVHANKTVTEILSTYPGEVIALYAYMLAMDNYSNVSGVEHWSRMAQEKKPNSLTVNMIDALIQAQMALDEGDSWCQVYQVVENVHANKALEQDLNEKAVQNILEYTGDYKEYCK